MIIVDAGVLVVALGDDGAHGDDARQRLADEGLAAPELIDLEVASVLRRLAQAGQLTPQRAKTAIDSLAALPIRRLSHRPLLDRIWELRENLTTYDASYVAVAEQFEATLVTTDRRLAGAPGIRCAVELLGAG